jgi:Zn finger protein HypA/HybF involved in hydrogenase expression
MPARIVIWLLGGALLGTAVAAILALLMPNAEAAWRLTGTGGLLAASCLASLPAVRSWESGRPSIYSRVASVVIAGALAIGLAAIWWEPIVGRTGFEADRLWVTDLLLGFWLLLVWLPCRLLPNPWWRRTAIVVLAMVSAAFLLFVVEVLQLWSGDSGSRGSMLLTYAPLLGALALPSPADHRSIWRWGRWLGVAAAVTAMGTLLVALPSRWDDPRLAAGLVQAVTALTAIALLAAVGVALELAKGPPWRKWVQRITIGLVALEGALVTLSVEQLVGPEVIVPLGLVTVVGLVAAVLLDAVGRIAERKARAVATLTDVRLSCPRCGKSQAIGLGRVGRCERCGLGIEVRVQQDECLRCGYSRVGLSADATCPECGAAGATVTDGLGSDARIA